MNNRGIALSLVIIAGIFGAWMLLKQSDRNSNDLIVGTAAGYAPFVSINAHGDYEGFDVDVANALAKQMGKKLVLQDLGSMTSLFTALDQGTIDCILWGLSITQDRLKKVAMIRYQGETVTTYPLIFWKNIPEGISSIADMNNKIICAEPGSSQEAVLRSFPSITLLSVEKIDDALLNIQYGKADAALVEPAIAKKFKNKYSEIQMLPIPLDAEQQVHGIGIAVRKNNNDLVKVLDLAATNLQQDGLIRSLEQKWELE
jgi:ABC-type amino acid transport substrate-binding protein